MTFTAGSTGRRVAREVETPIPQPARCPRGVVEEACHHSARDGDDHLRDRTVDSGLGQEGLGKVPETDRPSGSPRRGAPRLSRALLTPVG